MSDSIFKEMAEIRPLTNLQPARSDRPDILKKLTTATPGWPSSRVIGRSSYYINSSLSSILIGKALQGGEA